MNKKAAQLGMSNSHFADPAGLNVENMSTARDLMKMVTAAHYYALIGTSQYHHTYRSAPLRKTRATGLRQYQPLVEKQDLGYQPSARPAISMKPGRCLVMQANIEGEDISIVLLNSFGKLTPFGDSNRLRKWMLAKS